MVREQTKVLDLTKPDKLDQYNIADFNDNFQKIDDFAGTIPPRALRADEADVAKSANKLTNAPNINGVQFDGSENVITGLGLYSPDEVYNETNIVYNWDSGSFKIYRSLQDDNIGNDLDDDNYWQEIKISGGESEKNNPFYFGFSLYSPIEPNNVSLLKSNRQQNLKSLYPDYYDWIVEQRAKNIKYMYGWAADTWTDSPNPKIGDKVYGFIYPLRSCGVITAVTENSITATVSGGSFSGSGITRARLESADGYMYVCENDTDVLFVTKEEAEAPANRYWGHNFDYDFIINDKDETFFLPLLNGSECILSDDYIDYTSQISLTERNQRITCPTNGFFSLSVQFTNVNSYTQIRNATKGFAYQTLGITATGYNASIIPCERGDVVQIDWSGTPTSIYWCRFFKAKGNGSLYYYVGETVQNANLIDAGRITETLSNKVDINSDVIDGQWVYKYVVLASGVTTVTEKTNYDLKNYLPDDNHQYEVLFTGWTSSSSTKGAITRLRLATDIVPYGVFCGSNKAYDNVNQPNSGNVTLPVGSERYVQFYPENTNTGDYNIHVIAYRRIGTNK